MRWIEQALSQFCQELEVPLPSPIEKIIQLVFEHSGTLQLEQHDEQLTLWLSCEVPWHQAQACMARAMSACWSQQASELPLRCSWLGEQQLLLLITLDERQVTVPVLHQSFKTLIDVRRKVMEQ